MKTWELEEKWAHVHMKWSFTAGMRSTQLSESLNAQIKRHLKCDNNLGLFFTFFDQVVLEKRYKEIQAKFDSKEKMVKINFCNCPMLLHAAKFYTPHLFDLFHKQFDISLGCKVIETWELEDEIGFVVQRHGQEREYKVLGRVELNALGVKTLTKVSCSCRKFESFGILCGHAIKVLSQMNVMKIPKKYILGRWRLDAKSCSSKGKEVMVEENGRKLVILARYRHLCPKAVTLVARVSEDDEAYKLVENTMTLLCAQVDNIFLSKHGFGASSSGPKSPNIDMGLDLIDPKDGETPYYPQMAHLQSQASCSTQVSEMAFERSILIPMEAESMFDDEEFLEALVSPHSHGAINPY
ncbi:hypothetical protein Vadar_002988 [Vaccinium darrowii]|uniref:Uncharacterized protein n=1 Tax=Vaccinium darrowii TaxID=229202 RepID=A0ACB7YK14_9ERIC|nr:hypothetical protein Vadar_002988 [Vaccinium darrowii]